MIISRRTLTCALTALLLAAAPAAARASEPEPAPMSVMTDSAACEAQSVDEPLLTPDSIPEDSVRPKVPKTLWIKQLFANGFHINDPSVAYPRFPRFLLNVYNWGDRTFNGYDPEYVVSTGKNWKVLAKSYDWVENYAMIFSRHQTMRMRSDVYADIGGYICFMAVSVGYMFNANELIGDRHDTRSNFNLNFTCSRFTIDYTDMSTRGGARITDFGSSNKSDLKSIKFEGISNKTRSLTTFYIFNNRRYSHAAAYCYSKYQLKSAGSWLAGFLYNYQRIGLDFNSLPQYLLDKLPPEAQTVYTFRYRDYAALGGYGYNCVMKPRRWLFNVTALLGVGYKHTSEEIRDGSRSMVALTPVMNMAMVYNHRALFVGLNLKALYNFYFNSNYTFLSGILSFQATVGARF